MNNSYLRALPNFANSLGEHDENYNERGVKAMLAHAWNMCHVKDSVEGEKGQRKTVDLARMFALAEQGSYRGYYSMEFRHECARSHCGGTKVGTGEFAVFSVRR